MSISRLILWPVFFICTLPLVRGEQSVIPVIPDFEKESPFFTLNNTSLNPTEDARQKLTGPQYDYPRNKGAEQSAGQMFTTFFTDMFGSVHLGKESYSGSKLIVEPTDFSLDERREITVTFKVENRTNKLVRLDFPTTQRIEILVRDGNGRVVEKWSDDRAFTDVAGVVMINPNEHIQYEEKISTRDMQPGLTYTIEASLANNPEFTKTETITPSGKPRILQPNPALKSTVPDSTPPPGSPEG